MSLDFLDDSEIYIITRRRKWAAQLRMLKHLGYVARKDGNGRPLVARAYVEAKFGIAKTAERKPAEPNWDALDAKKTARR